MGECNSATALGSGDTDCEFVAWQHDFLLRVYCIGFSHGSYELVVVSYESKLTIPTDFIIELMYLPRFLLNIIAIIYSIKVDSKHRKNKDQQRQSPCTGVLIKPIHTSLVTSTSLSHVSNTDISVIYYRY